MDLSILNLSPNSRIWIYQCNRELTESEVKEIKILGDAYVVGWTAHEQKLKAGFDIRYNRFLILAVDETAAFASGCSIDNSIGFIKSLEEKYGLNLLDRMQIAYRNGQSIETVHFNDFKTKIQNGELNEATTVFNNLVKTVGELNSKWEVAAKESWHRMYLT